MGKRIAAVAMQHRIGETFAAVVTGVTTEGRFRAGIGSSRGRNSGARASRASMWATGCR